MFTQQTSVRDSFWSQALQVRSRHLRRINKRTVWKRDSIQTRTSEFDGCSIQTRTSEFHGGAHLRNSFHRPHHRFTNVYLVEKFPITTVSPRHQWFTKTHPIAPLLEDAVGLCETQEANAWVRRAQSAQSQRQMNAYSACKVKMPVAVKRTAATTRSFASAPSIFSQRWSQTSVLEARCSAWHRLRNSTQHVRTTLLCSRLHRSHFQAPPRTVRHGSHTFATLQLRVLAAHHADI